MDPIANPFLTAMKELAVFLGKKMDSVSAAIKGMEKKEPVDFSPVVRAVDQLKAVVANQKTPEFSGTVKIDQSPVKNAVDAVAAAIKKLDFPSTNTSMIEAKLDKLSFVIEKNMQKSEQITREFSTGLVTIAKALDIKIPSTFKIDDRQFQALSNVGSAGAGVGTTPLTMATRILNTTVTAASTGIQYSYTFPSGTIGWIIKLRDQGTLGYYSWTASTLPTSGSGTTYMTIPQNFLRSQDNVEYAGKTIYLGAEANSQTFEIEVFRR